MNLTKAYTQYIGGGQDVAGSVGGAIGAVGWDFGGFGNALANNDYPMTTILLGGTNLTATLAWFRDRTYVPGSYVATDDSFANLDLQLWNSTFTTMFASSEGLYDSNEHLSLTIPATGSYGIRVSRKNNMFGALAGLDYGLAWSATAIPEPSYILMLGTAALIVTSLRHRRGYAAS